MPCHEEIKSAGPKYLIMPLRLLFGVILFAACVSTVGCASNTVMAQNNSCLKGEPWQAAGNNGGKADRVAVARAAASCSSEDKP
jgi:hypothetical protein